MPQRDVGGIERYQPLSIDIEVQRRQREEFQVAKFISSLDYEYAQNKHSILASDKLPSLNNVYSHLQHMELQSFPSGNGIKDTPVLASIGQGRGGPPIRG